MLMRKLSRELLFKNLPSLDDPDLLPRLQSEAYPYADESLFTGETVPWDHPRAVNRLGYVLGMDPQILAQNQLFPYRTGEGTCPMCRSTFGSKMSCLSCEEHREHFQVLGSLIVFRTQAGTLPDLDLILEVILKIEPATRILILSKTKERSFAPGIILHKLVPSY
jgi:hypothetical protein